MYELFKINYMKLLKTLFLSLISSSAAFAQAPAGGNAPDARPVAPFPTLLDQPMFYFWVIFISVLLFVILSLVKAIHVLADARLKPALAHSSVAEKVKRKTAWQKMMDALTRSVPVEREKDVLLDHNYDGIMELDNKLPPWWVWGFYITIFFAFAYIIYYHMSGVGKLPQAEYQAELTAAALEKEERIRMNANYVTDENVVMLTDADALKEGASIFQKNCLACHGDKGQGGVGPNMTDEYWLHGGGIKNIFHTISEGVPSKGMISWKSQLSPKQIQQVASFLMTLVGTNPPGAKEPQGDVYSAGTDSTQTTEAVIDTAKAVLIKVKV